MADINLGKTPFSLILFHIRQKDEQCSMSYMRVLKAVSPKSFHHTGKIVLFNFVSVWDDGCSLNLNGDHRFMMYVSQIALLDILN